MGIQINGNTDTISALDGSWTSDSATHFTGKVSIGGTLTYEDVTNIDSVGLVTARDGVFIPDNKELKIGNTAGTPDLKIYHSSSDNNSYIKESGTGSLFVNASRFEVSNAAGTEALINAIQDTGVSLYDGTNTVRLATTNTGATVTGTLTATTFSGALTTTDACQVGDLTILNGNPDLKLQDSNHAGNNTEHMIAFKDSSGNNQMNIGSPFGEQHLRIKHGTTDLVKIQTDGKVGVGTAAPAQKVHITASSGDVYYQTDTTVNGGLILHVDGTQRGLFANDSAFSGTKTDIAIGAKGNMIFRTGTSSYDERLRIDSNGNIGVNCDSPTNISNSRGITIQGASSTPAGFINFMDYADNSDARILADNGVLTITADASDNTSSSAIAFNVDGTSEKVRIDSNGTLSIGAVTPTFTSPTPSLNIEKTSTGSGPVISLYNGQSANAASTCEILVRQNYRGANKIIFGRENANNWQASATSAASYMAFETNSAGTLAERLRIHSDGRIIPAISGGKGGVSLVGAFMARPTSTYDTNSGLLKITLGTEEFDANGWFDTSNSRYTPLCKGWYQFNFFIQYQTNITGESVEVFLYPYKNGSNVGGGPVHGWNTNYGNYAFITFSTMIYCDGVDDYIEMYANCSRSTDVSVNTRMSGFLVHPIT